MRRFKILLTIARVGLLCYAGTAAAQSSAELLARSDSFSFYFPFNSDTISASQTENAAPLLTRIRKGSVDSVSIQAFADSAGAVPFNRLLSQKRMERVLQLIGATANDAGFSVRQVAWGEEKAGRLPGDSLDRRVDLAVYWKEKPVVDNIMVLSDLHFMPDRAVLQPSSMGALENYGRLLAAYRNRLVEIRGHVNYQFRKLPVTHPYFKLSEARAKLVADYLVEQGHRPELIKAVGMGNWQPAVPDARTVPEKESNMRVEIVIYQ